MKLIFRFVPFAAMLIFAVSGSVAQNASAAPAPPPTIASAIDVQVGILEREFVSAAEAMPDDKFNFSPGSAEHQRQRVQRRKDLCRRSAPRRGHEFPALGRGHGRQTSIETKEDNGPPQLKTKAEIVKYLKDSFALGHKAAKSLTAETAVALVPSPFGQGQTTKLFCASFAVAHGFDHYGQMVEYLRMNGIIPPASRPQK